MNLIHLRMIAGYYAYARTNPGPVTSGSNQLHLDPVVLISAVVAQQRWDLIHIVHNDIYIAVIVVISEGATAARVERRDSRSQLFGYVLKLPISEVAIDDACFPERLTYVLLINGRVNVAVYLQDVRPAIVVVIKETASPLDSLGIEFHAGLKCHFCVGSVAIVVVEVRRIVCEIGLEDIEPAVAVVIRHTHAHAGLLDAVLAVRAPRHYSDVCKRSIMVVVQQDASLGIDRNVNVGPSVVVEVVRHCGDRIARSRLENSRFF